jgi:hypothetical protein
VSFEQTTAVITEGGSSQIKAVLDRPSSLPVYAEFQIFQNSTKPDETTTAEPARYEITPSNYRVEFLPGETEQLITIEIFPSTDTTGADKRVTLIWRRTETVRETPEMLKVYINQFMQPWQANLGNAEVKRVRTDSDANVYIAYTITDPATQIKSGRVDIVNRLGTGLVDSIPFAIQGQPSLNHELTNIFIREYDGEAGGGAQNRFRDLYLVGTTEGNTAAVSAGGRDILIERLQSINRGAFGDRRATQLGTDRDDIPHGVFVDTANSVSVVGETFGGFEETPNAGSSDAFIVRIDAAGQREISRSIGSAGRDVFLDAVGVGRTTQLVVTGFSTGQFEDVILGGRDAIVGSYNREGFVQRLDQYGNELDNVGTRVQFLDRALVVGGYTSGPVRTSLLSAGGEDVFLTYHMNASAVDGSMQFGSAGDDRLLDMITDGTDVFVTGFAGGPIDAGQIHSGGRDAFLKGVTVKDRKFEKSWVIQQGTTENNMGSGVALTPSQKLMWLIETPSVDGSGTRISVSPYNRKGESLLKP